MPAFGRGPVIRRHVFALLVAVVGCGDGMEGVDRTGGGEADVRLEEADAHFEAGRFDRALDLYEALLDGDPADVPNGRLHRTYLALGLADQARDLAARRRASGGGDADAAAWHCDLGMIAIQAGDRDALGLHTDSLARIATDAGRDVDPGALECLAFHEVFAGRFAEARDHLELLSGIDGEDASPANLAFLYLEEGRTEEAEPILAAAETAAAMAAVNDPDDPEPHFERAEFAAMRGDVATAVAALSDAMDRGLGRTWWIYQLFDPESLPDPVFAPLYGDPDFERMRATVVEERTRMLSGR